MRWEEGGGEAVERAEEACESVGGEREGEVGGVERGVGKSGKSEKEKGEWGDTCVLVDPVLSSAVVLGASAPEWGDKREECWWRSGPGR